MTARIELRDDPAIHPGHAVIQYRGACCFCAVPEALELVCLPPRLESEMPGRLNVIGAQDVYSEYSGFFYHIVRITGLAD
jgi:hypothetical protein